MYFVNYFKNKFFQALHALNLEQQYASAQGMTRNNVNLVLIIYKFVNIHITYLHKKIG